MLVSGEARTADQLRAHYLVERELADRLRRAAPAERAALYATVYDELFRRVPDHPQLLACRDRGYAEGRRRRVEREWRLLERFLEPGGVFMEVGAGDCALSIRAAAAAREVYAIDVSEQITAGTERPANLELRLTTGAAIPVASGSVDLAYSNQLLEHLHPEDALEQLREIRRSLVRGGAYLCITSNRLSGPHDISGYYDEQATGLHLREYCARDLLALFTRAGFREVRFLAGARGWYLRVPYALVAGAERLLDALPRRLRRAAAGLAPVRALLGLRVLAVT